MEFDTLCSRSEDETAPVGRPLAPVIVPSSTFRFGSQAEIDEHYRSSVGYVYSRYANPTVRGVERLLATLEGAEDAAIFASGMGAISTVLFELGLPRGKVAAQRELYGGSVELLERFLPESGIEVVWLSRDELDGLSPERLDGCGVLFLETPVNPTLRVIDLRRAAAAAHEAGVPVAVDSTFATPALLRPISLGVDLVVHSATKYLGGHGDLVGGAVAGPAELLDPIRERRRVMGATMDAFSAFLLHRGIRTLAIRMRAHSAGATVVAEALSRNPRVSRVNFPGLPSHPDADLAREQMAGPGGMVSFEVAGGAEQAVRVHDALKLFACAGSLGGVESLVSIPARMSHRNLDEAGLARAGVSPALVRLSVGLESPIDLVADLEQALSYADTPA